MKFYNKKNEEEKKSEDKEEIENEDCTLTFGEELKMIDEKITKDINQFNAKQEKDVMLLIDFNIYSERDGSLSDKINIIDSFIDKSLVIFNDYLSSSDRFGLIIYDNDYKIICPLIYKNQIDIENFYEDLNNSKNNFFNKNNDKQNSDIDFNEFNLDISNDIYNSKVNLLEIYINEKNYYEKIISFVKTINNINDYKKIKEGVNKEKYIIIFTDIVNLQKLEDKQINKIFDNLLCNKSIILLLVGKNSKLNDTNKNNIIKELILNKFG